MTVSDRRVADDLRELTEELEKHGADPHGGGLGGMYGYGTNFENDVFVMHPFWWGDCECGFDDLEAEWDKTHSHETSCYQNEIRRRDFIDWDDPRDDTMPFDEVHKHNQAITDAVCAEMGLDPRGGSYVHCTCSWKRDWDAWRSAHDHDPLCGMVRPNFLHKPSGVRVDWYKYIGRGMEITKGTEKRDWDALFAECIASITE